MPHAPGLFTSQLSSKKQRKTTKEPVTSGCKGACLHESAKTLGLLVTSLSEIIKTYQNHRPSMHLLHLAVFQLHNNLVLIAQHKHPTLYQNSTDFQRKIVNMDVRLIVRLIMQKIVQQNLSKDEVHPPPPVAARCVRHGSCAWNSSSIASKTE